MELKNMITTFKDLRFYLVADAIMSRTQATFVQRLFHNNKRGKFLRTLRIVEWLHNTYKQPLHWWKLIPLCYYQNKLDRLSYQCGFDIPLNTLGYGVNIAHHGSITINPLTKIGNYCAIMNNVVIGDSNEKVIGNGVLIGSNTVILKKITIADGCQIAAMSLINKTITKPNTLVGGVNLLLKPEIATWYEGDEVVNSNHAKCEMLRNKMYKD